MGAPAAGRSCRPPRRPAGGGVLRSSGAPQGGRVRTVRTGAGHAGWPAARLPVSGRASRWSSTRPGTRELLAGPAEGRRARRLEARPPRPQPRPSGQHRAGPVRPRRGPAGARWSRRADRHHHRGRPRRVRHLRGAGRVRAGADPRTHRGRGSRPHGHAHARAAGSSRCRKPRCGWPKPRWRTATPLCPNSVGGSADDLTTLSQHQHVVIGMRDARRVGEHLTHAMAEGVDRRAEGVI